MPAKSQELQLRAPDAEDLETRDEVHQFACAWAAVPERDTDHWTEGTGFGGVANRCRSPGRSPMGCMHDHAIDQTDRQVHTRSISQVEELIVTAD
jgi:hypothetical protein